MGEQEHGSEHHFEPSLPPSTKKSRPADETTDWSRTALCLGVHLAIG